MNMPLALASEDIGLGMLHRQTRVVIGLAFLVVPYVVWSGIALISVIYYTDEIASWKQCIRDRPAGDTSGSCSRELTALIEGMADWINSPSVAGALFWWMSAAYLFIHLYATLRRR